MPRHSGAAGVSLIEALLALALLATAFAALGAVLAQAARAVADGRRATLTLLLAADELARRARALEAGRGVERVGGFTREWAVEDVGSAPPALVGVRVCVRSATSKAPTILCLETLRAERP
ncbi:MAG: hypothetical protein AB1635_07550 [Acidobacteriota bacterium]